MCPAQSTGSIQLCSGDQNFEGHGTNGAYKLFVSGSTATVVGTLPFTGTQKRLDFGGAPDLWLYPTTPGTLCELQFFERLAGLHPHHQNFVAVRRGSKPVAGFLDATAPLHAECS